MSHSGGGFCGFVNTMYQGGGVRLVRVIGVGSSQIGLG